MEYDCIAVDLLLREVRSGALKITMARIHPDDMPRVNMEGIKRTLMVSILPSSEVQRGFLYIDSVSARAVQGTKRARKG